MRKVKSWSVPGCLPVVFLLYTAPDALLTFLAPEARGAFTSVGRGALEGGQWLARESVPLLGQAAESYMLKTGLMLRAVDGAGGVANSNVAGWTRATGALGEADAAQYANLKSYYHSLDEGLHQGAATKGYPGIRLTGNGNPDFSSSRYLYSGEKNIVDIQMTGNYYQDFKAANELAGFSGAKAPSGYTWHHMDNFNPVTGTTTMQLVEQGAHTATYSHFGSVSQYRNYFGTGYR